MIHRSSGDDSGAHEGGRPGGLFTEALSTNVRLWKIAQVKSKRAPYQLRWTVDGRVKTASFATITLADSRRSQLRQAMTRGEAFGVDSGLPVSELRAAANKKAEKGDLNWWAFSREYMAVRWRTAAAKTREGLADSLATVAIAMAGEGSKAP
ncbi:site-specific integrase, partial [Streptomyces sp. NPDC056491]